MNYSCKILLDSVNPDGKRITTFELVFARAVLSEFNKHRAITSNTASSRAIPWKKFIKMVKTNPYCPEVFRAAKKGMQGGEPIEGLRGKLLRFLWLNSRHIACAIAYLMGRLGTHKQYINRLLEPWMHVTVIATGTEWANFFKLRTARNADPAIQKIALMMFEEYKHSVPTMLAYGAWHLPLIDPDEKKNLVESEQIKVCVGRCARVSYLNHFGIRNFEDDIRLHDQLLQDKHMTPFEHVAKSVKPSTKNTANFKGFQPYRKTIPGECYEWSTDIPFSLT